MFLAAATLARLDPVVRRLIPRQPVTAPVRSGGKSAARPSAST